MIVAGDKSQIRWADGSWIFLDIGFSSKEKTCGFILGDGGPECHTFRAAGDRIIKHIERSRSPVSLVIEAPLSVCFDSEGNPKGRKIEKQEGQARYWFVGAGCMVLVAAMYLIRGIHDASLGISIRLFEGFISYKQRSGRSTHEADVESLREVVKNPKHFASSIYDATQLRADSTDTLCSAFSVAGLDCGIPPVIMRRLG